MKTEKMIKCFTGNIFNTASIICLDFCVRLTFVIKRARDKKQDKKTIKLCKHAGHKAQAWNVNYKKHYWWCKHTLSSLSLLLPFVVNM